MVRWLLLCLPLLAAGAQKPAPEYVGSDVCKTCHADIWLNFYKNPHYRSIASGLEPPERTGCEGCHGPGGGHVAARGGKTTIPRAFSLMGPRETIDTCLGCHARDFGKVNIRRSDHTQAGIACTSCHSIHKSPAAAVPAGQNAAGGLLRLPRHGARAVLHALQAPRQRRLHGVHGLPQPARRFQPDLAHGPAAAHGGAGARPTKRSA